MGDTLFIIEIKHADGESVVHEIKDELRVLGRSRSSADIMLDDKKVSGQHVELSYVEGAVMLRDLDSTNGTYFCDARIHDSVEVRPGESFQVGDASIRIMAIFGSEVADDAKTMVSMPAWMDESKDLGADSTRALSADEIAAVMAATIEPVSGIAFSESNGHETPEALEASSEVVESFQATSEPTYDSTMEEAFESNNPGFVEESPKADNLPPNATDDGLSADVAPAKPTTIQTSDAGSRAGHVLAVARNVSQHLVRYSLAFGGVLWRLAKWSFRGMRELIAKGMERLKSSE